MKTINNLKIGARLVLFFSIIVVITAAGLTFMTLRTKSISKQVDLIYNVHLLSMEYLIEADRDAYQSSIALSHALSLFYKATPAEIQQLIKDVNENQDQVLQRYTKFENLSGVAREKNNMSIGLFS